MQINQLILCHSIMTALKSNCLALIKMASSLKIVPFLSFSFLKNEKKKKAHLKAAKIFFPPQGPMKMRMFELLRKGIPSFRLVRRGWALTTANRKHTKFPSVLLGL